MVDLHNGRIEIAVHRYIIKSVPRKQTCGTCRGPYTKAGYFRSLDPSLAIVHFETDTACSPALLKSKTNFGQILYSLTALTMFL